MRTLEELGIGRPSTYASIIGTILDRGYVFKRGTALVPAFLAFSVVGLLEQHFGRLVDYDFTARMEDDLDRIAAGDEQRVEWLRRFYFGDGDGGLHELVSDLGAIDAREINSLEIGNGIVAPRRPLRAVPRARRAARERPRRPRARRADGRAGRGAARAAQSATASSASTPRPGCRSSRAPAATARTSPRCCPEGSKEKPRTASLFKSMSLDTVTLDDALRLLQLPRSLGAGDDGEEVVAQNGRYGPYVQKGKESRSLESEEQLFTIDLPGALALLAQPRQRRGQRPAAKQPLRELGTDPVGGKEIVLKEGRFGPYVTDGETNASLRKGDDPETVTLDRAARAARRAPREGPGEARRPSPQGFLNGSPQTSPTGQRPMLDGPGRSAEYTCRAARSSDRSASERRQVPSRVVTGGLPS